MRTSACGPRYWNGCARKEPNWYPQRLMQIKLNCHYAINIDSHEHPAGRGRCCLRYELFMHICRSVRRRDSILRCGYSNFISENLYRFRTFQRLAILVRGLVARSVLARSIKLRPTRTSSSQSVGSLARSDLADVARPARYSGD